jgi:hypothetical protein
LKMMSDLSSETDAILNPSGDQHRSHTSLICLYSVLYRVQFSLFGGSSLLAAKISGAEVGGFTCHK